MLICGWFYCCSIGKHMENTFELVGHRHVMLRDNTLKIISLMKGTRCDFCGACIQT